MDRGDSQGYSPRGHKELDATEGLNKNSGNTWHVGCGILVPWRGVEAVTPGVEAGEHNHQEIPLLWSLLWGFIVSLGRALIRISIHPFIHLASSFSKFAEFLRYGILGMDPYRTIHATSFYLTTAYTIPPESPQSVPGLLSSLIAHYPP